MIGNLQSMVFVVEGRIPIKSPYISQASWEASVASQACRHVASFEIVVPPWRPMYWMLRCSRNRGHNLQTAACKRFRGRWCATPSAKLHQTNSATGLYLDSTVLKTMFLGCSGYDFPYIWGPGKGFHHKSQAALWRRPHSGAPCCPDHLAFSTNWKSFSLRVQVLCHKVSTQNHHYDS